MKRHDPEKRRSPRIQPFVAPCRVVAGEKRTTGYLTDLSVEGARVSCERDAPVQGDLVTLEFRLGRGTAPATLRARVVWVGPDTSGRTAAGLTFEGLSAEEAHALSGVVEEFQKRAAAL